MSGRRKTDIYLHPKGTSDFGKDVLVRNRVFREINAALNYLAVILVEVLRKEWSFLGKRLYLCMDKPWFGVAW